MEKRKCFLDTKLAVESDIIEGAYEEWVEVQVELFTYLNNATKQLLPLRVCCGKYDQSNSLLSLVDLFHKTPVVCWSFRCQI